MEHLLGIRGSTIPSNLDENIAAEQEEMREEQHQLDLKENYESDEEFEESKD